MMKTFLIIWFGMPWVIYLLRCIKEREIGRIDLRYKDTWVTILFTPILMLKLILSAIWDEI